MPQVIWKSINPTPLNYRAMREQLLDGLKEVGIEIRQDFDKTVETWHDKPDFAPTSQEPVVRGHIATVETSTVDKVYGYVSEGTQPHIILPRNAKSLVFPGTFRAKTTPGTIQSAAGFSGPPTIHSQGVLHPGVTPRKFDELIAERQKNRAKKTIEAAMSRARRVSGHSK